MMEINRNGAKYLVHAAWAENAKGSGWSNRMYWVIVSEKEGPNSGVLRKVSIQWEEMNAELITLFRVSESVQQEVLSACAEPLSKKGWL